MAITKEAVVEKMEIVGKWTIQIATDTVIKEDGTEISRSRHRHVLEPYLSTVDGSTWTHTDTDISSEDDTVKAVCNAVWTDTVKTAYKTWKESQEVL
jgi:hypothetical protein